MSFLKQQEDAAKGHKSKEDAAYTAYEAAMAKAVADLDAALAGNHKEFEAVSADIRDKNDAAVVAEIERAHKAANETPESEDTGKGKKPKAKKE